MNREDRLIWATGAALAALAAWWWWADGRAQAARGGGERRELAPSAVLPAGLDATLGQLTPERLLAYGPGRLPVSWRRHGVRYPATPGAELGRLQSGAPGASITAVPRELRGWLVAPPAEVDF